MKQSPLSLSLLLALVILGGSGYWSFGKFNELTNVKNGITESTSAMSTLTQAELPDSEGALQEAKNNQSGALTSAEIKRIFPPLAFKTDLYRNFEAFFESLNTKENPMLVNSISIPDPKNDAELGAGIITINLNIESTEKNFREFMKWVETSGYPEPTVNKKPKTQTARLMSIESIQIQFPDEPKEGEKEAAAAAQKNVEKETLTYNVVLNTYVKLQED